jgi:peroxiredoxin Q/BCP
MFNIQYAVLCLLLLGFVAGNIFAGGTRVETGKPAPDFTLKDQNGHEYSLSDFKGQWVLIYFYPKDDTPGCTTEACTFRDRYADIQTSELNVIGISTDDVKSHKSFSAKYNLPFTLLADTSGEVSKIYGTKFPIINTAKRQSFLIDPKGIVRKIYEKVTPADHPEEILEDLKKLKEDKKY